MRIETDRLLIIDLTPDMAETIHLNSLDEDMRRFVPDEVFETIDEARETVEFLIGQYASEDGPFVYPILLKTGSNIGYVQLVRIEKGWEIGYHWLLYKQMSISGYGQADERVCLEKQVGSFIAKQSVNNKGDPHESPFIFNFQLSPFIFHLTTIFCVFTSSPLIRRNT